MRKGQKGLAKKGLKKWLPRLVKYGFVLGIFGVVCLAVGNWYVKKFSDPEDIIGGSGGGIIRDGLHYGAGVWAAPGWNADSDVEGSTGSGDCSLSKWGGA